MEGGREGPGRAEGGRNNEGEKGMEKGREGGGISA